jgi:hypothetical protein
VTAAAAAAAGRPPGARAYLALAAILAPLCVPSGPGQIGALDVMNLIALPIFGLALLGSAAYAAATQRDPSQPRFGLRAPLLLPVTCVALGSLLATVNAPSLESAALAMLQDFYLFSWFLLVVNLVREPADLRALRVAWMGAGVAVALVALGQVFLHSGGSLGTFLSLRGARPAATLYNPNMLADYLVLSVFVTLGLAREVPRPVWTVALLVLLVGLVATKSNGGLLAFGAGGAVWLGVHAFARRNALRGPLAVTALLGALCGIGLWLHSEFGIGDSALRALTKHTFMGRIEHSSASRLHIWDQLQRTYARTPLGIGPGNSGALTVGIADRERRDSYRSKEAHNDYLAYAIERGPFGLLGLLLITVAGFAQVARFSRSARRLAERAGPPGPGTVPARPDGTAWSAAMAAALTASAVHSAVIEKLHFRHFWLLLALVCASSILATELAADPSAVTASEPGADGAGARLRKAGSGVPVQSTGRARPVTEALA